MNNINVIMPNFNFAALTELNRCQCIFSADTVIVDHRI